VRRPATRPLGRTGLRLTELGQGTAPLGGLFELVSDEDADGVLAAAWEAGVRYVDTAPWYGHGLSEHRTGRFLRRVPRDAFVLSTKVGRVLRRRQRGAAVQETIWAGALPFEYAFDYGYDGVLRSWEDSLQRLGLDRVDLLAIHDLDVQHHGSALAAHLSELERGGLRALAELRDAGEIAGVGAGINELGMIPRLLALADLDFVILALPYTLLDQEALEEELPLCSERGVGVVIGAPFASGVLAPGAGRATYAYGPVPADVAARVRRLRAACARHGVALAAAALQFPLGHPAVASVIPGALTGAQARENTAAFAAPVPSALWDELRRDGLFRPDVPVPV
jgi:D-threo-aldose 1-dehydrogenase